MANYVNGEWDAHQSNYTEGAKLYFNTTEDKPATMQIAAEKAASAELPK